MIRFNDIEISDVVRFSNIETSDVVRFSNIEIIEPGSTDDQWILDTGYWDMDGIWIMHETWKTP